MSANKGLKQRLENFKPYLLNELLEGVVLPDNVCAEGCTTSKLEHIVVCGDLLRELFSSRVPLHWAMGWAMILEGLCFLACEHTKEDEPIPRNMVLKALATCIDRLNERTSSLLSPRM